MDRKKRPQSVAELRAMLADEAPNPQAIAARLERALSYLGEDRKALWTPWWLGWLDVPRGKRLRSTLAVAIAFILLMGGYSAVEYLARRAEERAAQQRANEVSAKSRALAEAKRSEDQRLRRERQDKEERTRQEAEAEAKRKAEAEERARSEAARKKVEDEENTKRVEAEKKRIEEQRNADEAKRRPPQLPWGFSTPDEPVPRFDGSRAALRDFVGVWAKSDAGCQAWVSGRIPDKVTGAAHDLIGICDHGLERLYSTFGCDAHDIVRHSDAMEFSAACRARSVLLPTVRMRVGLKGTNQLSFEGTTFLVGWELSAMHDRL